MKLHLGCGKRYIPGYVHIDAVDYPHVDHVCSIDNLSFIADDSCDVIYNCHVLEHFKRREVVKVLAEWRRVLKPDGILRISVPDFAAICEIYRLAGSIDPVVGPLFGRQDYLYNIHYNVFDFNYLAKELMSVGFTKVNRYNWRETEHANIDDYSQAYYPHMDKENGLLVSLNIEAVK
ncbi:MAG: methyltransferase domain-containing protein [Rhodoferax sp.]|uniref:class I SAM-dependent methyltransferase n=1 Tax=Rhodoferax sp. TaxID=50421 RepID=UPI00260509D1|nr:methyltransferase domain-containing protein [Rhodoferax sp.]MDD2882987.1 methyltransferase domain-containing protein [Rhodoferax sp.]